MLYEFCDGAQQVLQKRVHTPSSGARGDVVRRSGRNEKAKSCILGSWV